MKYFFTRLVCFLFLFDSYDSICQSAWTRKANFPGAARGWDVGFSIGHYGFVGTGSGTTFYNDFYKWNQTTNTWSSIPNYPGGGYEYTPIAFAIEGKGYVGLGWTGIAGATDLWAYDTITNTWNQMANFPGRGRYDATTFVIGHKAYLVAGSTGGPPYLNDVWVYDAHANTWNQLNNYPGGNVETQISFAIGNHGYVGDGYWNSGCYQQMYEYDTTTDTWSTIANIPVTYGISSTPTAWVIGSKAYLCTGSECTNQGLRYGWMYDTVTRSWCEFGSMASAKISRGFAAAFTINNKGYFCTGLDTNWNYINDFWEYTPSTKINVSDTNLCSSDTVHFSDSTSYIASGWSWSFPGGNPSNSTLQNPSVSYSLSGTYTINLILTACGGNDTVAKTITVIGGGSNIQIGGKTPICVGLLDTITVSGGSSYLWSNGDTTSSIIISPDSTATYSVTVTGVCVNKDTSITIIVSPIPNPTISGIKSICMGDTTTLSVSGGVSYSWSTGATTSSISVNPVSSTTYTIAVSSDGCSKDTDIEVTVNPLPVAGVNGNTPICKGDSTILTASGGGSYLWSTGQTSSTIIVNPSSTFIYTISVTNSFGCKADTTYQVTVNIQGGAISGPPLICLGDTVSLTASGGGTYLWNTGATNSVISISPTTNTSYNVIVSNGCIDTVSASISVDAPQLYACCDTAIATPGTSVVLQSSGTLNYFWIPSNGLSCDSCPNPIVTPSVTTTYTVIGTDSAGCRLERTITIEVSGCLNTIIPNVFTPNSDGINDYFIIDAQYVSDYTITIYDRWGKKMYKSANPDVYWNGTNQNDNSAVPDGVYYYLIKYSCNNKSYNKDGFVEVVR